MLIRLASELQKDSIVDGEGIRAVIWTQGCPHKCPGCHNPETHDYKGGFAKDVEELKKAIVDLFITNKIDGSSTIITNQRHAEAIKVAIDEINAFLLNNEMLVILAIFDKSSYEIGEDLSSSINEYIGRNLLAMDSCAEAKFREDSAGLNRKGRRLQPFPNLRSSMAICEQPLLEKSVKPQSIEDIIEGLDESFSKKLFMLIDSKGMTDVECYKKANVSRQTWHKIISDPKYRPSKNTVISLAIALKLSYEQTDSLLESVGYALSSSIIFDVIIKYFLVNEKYDIFEIDSTLLKYDQVTLGSST